MSLMLFFLFFAFFLFEASRRERMFSLFFLSSLFVFQTFSLLDPSQRSALVDFYDATQGANWGFNQNWLTGDPCEDNWYGVNYFSFGSCNEENTTVTHFYLSQNQLNGTVPESFGNLKDLEVISMFSNHLQGEIPPFLSKATKLRELSIQWNKFTGTLPTEWNWPKMEALVLSGNNLQGTIPENIMEMREMKMLYLSVMNLTSTIPGSIKNLQHLKILEFSYTNLTGSIPPNILSLPKISMVNMRSANFTGELPLSWNPSSTLRTFYIDQNLLSGTIGDWVCEIPDYYFSNNTFSCPFPPSCSSLRTGECVESPGLFDTRKE